MVSTINLGRGLNTEILLHFVLPAEFQGSIVINQKLKAGKTFSRQQALCWHTRPPSRDATRPRQSCRNPTTQCKQPSKSPCRADIHLYCLVYIFIVQGRTLLSVNNENKDVSGLLHRDTLRQIARLIDVGATRQRHMVGQQLHRNRMHHR